MLQNALLQRYRKGKKLFYPLHNNLIIFAVFQLNQFYPKYCAYGKRLYVLSNDEMFF